MSIEKKEMKKCELCDSMAKMYCESDQASLCWNCDANVHGANFLVAKHSRTLLCHLCQSLTPWTGSGPRLSPTVSVCENCVNSSNCREDEGNNEDDNNSEDDEDDENGDAGNEDDEENQVVPWSSTPRQPVSSSSNGEECSGKFYNGDEGASSLKRMRDNTESSAQDWLVGGSSSQNNSNANISPDQKRTVTEFKRDYGNLKFLTARCLP